MLVIIGLAVLWYGLVPVVGALIKRYKWFKFRNRFNGFRLHPIMDNQAYWQMENNGGGHTRTFRFIGELESLTDKQVLWVRNEDLIVPVSLKNAESYLLSMQGDEGIPEISYPGATAPDKIRWEKVSSLTEGTKVFVGGCLSCQEGRWGFVSSKESPLMVIFHDGPDHSLATKTVWAGRHQGEYLNPVTPYSLIIGALCLLFIATFFLQRPAFRPAVIVSIAAIFTPLFPLVPPGLLFTVVYRHLTWKARILRAYSDLAKLPLCYFAPNGNGIQLRGKPALPDGEPYGFVCCKELPPEVLEGKIPLLIPEITELNGDNWYIFGTMLPSKLLPFRPRDPFATFGVLPGNPKEFIRRCTVKAYAMETVAWIILLAGISLNIFFLRLVLSLLI